MDLYYKGLVVMDCLNFQALQVKLVLQKMITQTIIKYEDNTRTLKQGDIIGICFENEKFKNYKAKIKKVKRTGLNKIKNEDIFKNGFLYKPHFLQFCKEKGIGEEDTILLVDFELVEVEL